MNRTRVLEVDNDFYQMHRNTRVDEHALEFISKIEIGNLHRYPIIPPFINNNAYYNLIIYKRSTLL